MKILTTHSQNHPKSRQLTIIQIVKLFFGKNRNLTNSSIITEHGFH